MSVIVNEYETIDSNSMSEHFKRMRDKYPNAPRIHLNSSDAPSNKSRETSEAAKKHGIMLHFLPPYSPNLNPIERLWKVMNEKVRDNVVFKNVADFKKTIMHFFHYEWTISKMILGQELTIIFL